MEIENIQEDLEKELSKKVGKEVKIKEITKAGSGYHSNGYKISTDSGDFFVKKIKSHDLGFEFPERKLSSLLVSHSMANKINGVKSLGVFVKNKEIKEIPEINEETEIFQIQEYGGDGTCYLDLLETDKTKVDEKDKEEIDQIVDYIVEVHKIKHPSIDKKRLDAVYNDFLRNVIGHPEYMLMLLHEMPKDNLVLPPEKQEEFLGLMIENMHQLKDRNDRLTALHGDFWAANAFFSDNKLFMIDYSRMPWGDPGFDIGFWIGTNLVKYFSTKNPYFKETGEYFLERYIEKTQDNEILKTMPYSLGLIAVIYASPRFVPDLEDSVREKMFNHAIKMLKEKTFSWPNA